MGITAIAGGGTTGYALRSDGTVWAWGSESAGAVGNGVIATTDAVTPIQVAGLSSITAISGTSQNGYALRSDGTVWAWGNGYWGSLGNGRTDTSATPVQVSGVANARALASNSGSTGTAYILRADGTVGAWGFGGLGDLGNGISAPPDGSPYYYSATPVEVHDLTGVTGIAAGADNGYAVLADGSVTAWGSGLNGSLGNGDLSGNNSTIPLRVTGLSGIIKVFGGYANGFAIAKDFTPPVVKRYVAIGDSYSSGEGNPRFVPSAGACDLSRKAWPYKLDNAVESIQLAGNIACSGAKTDALVEEFKGQEPQLEVMKALKPDLVTVTIGGNDVGFREVVRFCFYASAVVHLPGSCSKALRDEVAIIDAFGGIVSGIYNAIETEAPDARIIVVGYPRLFPQKQGNVVNCGWLTNDVRKRFNSLANQLDRELSAAANGVGLSYVSTLDALSGHELCTRRSWVNALSGSPPYQYQGHPNNAGQNAIALVVQSQL
jgi:lysophospholipase L1-like esterase